MDGPAGPDCDVCFDGSVVDEDGGPVFREVQRFAQNRSMWVFLVPLYALLGWASVQQLVVGQPLGTDPAPDWVLIVLVGLAVGLPFYPYLVTEVDGHHVRVHFPPARGLELTAADIVSFVETEYRPVREFGGWGYRIGWSGGKRAYNVAGNRGVRLHLRDGRQLVIGSQRPGELAAAIADVVG